MRIGGRIAVTREVFHRGNHAFALHSQGVGGGLLAHRLWVFAEAAHSDNRVGCIGVDIGDRRKVHMDAHALALLRNLLSHAVYQFVIVYGAKRHLIRISNCVLDTHRQSPLRVDADHQRGLCQSLPSVGLLQLGLCVGAEETHATDVVLLDILRHILIKRPVGLVGTHADQLRHTLLQREAVVNRIHPAVFHSLGEGLPDRQGKGKKTN